ncbi:MAG: Eco57I restriction-modification methylase domain-containing protein [Promethearchaeota archaeon]
MEWIDKLFHIHEKWISFQKSIIQHNSQSILDQTISRINHILLKFIGFQILRVKITPSLTDAKKEVRITSFLFLKVSTEKNLFLVDEKAFEEEIASLFQCEKCLIPELFVINEKNYNEKTPIYANHEIIRSFQQLERNSNNFCLKEDGLEFSNETKRENHITPAFMDYFYQNVILHEEKDKSHSGTFFSPSAEVSYSILNALNYLTLNNSGKNPKKSQNFFENGKALPKYLVDSIKCLLTSKNCSNSPIRILDPACGSGTFLIRFLQILLTAIKEDFSLKDNLGKIQLFGCDVRETAIQIAKFRIWCEIFNFFVPDINQVQLFLENSIYFIHGDFLLDFNKEISENTEFDLIIGNPPYIRHRNLRDCRNPPLLSSLQYRARMSQNLKKIKKEYKIDFSNHMDYSLYFFLQSFKYLSPNGVLSFITSNSWMNVKYGYAFQEFLLKFTNLWQIADNSARSFEYAEINTIISFLSKKNSNFQNPNGIPVSFIRWKKSFNSLKITEILEFLGNIEKNFYVRQEISPNSANKTPKLLQNDDLLRLLQISPSELYSWMKPNTQNHTHAKNSALYSTPYKGYNWGNYFLLAPSSFFVFHSLLGSKLSYLGKYMKITRGITTNCNDFFVLKKISRDSYINGYGDKVVLEPEVVQPFLASPRQVNFPILKPNQLNTYLFYTNLSKTELKRKRYINALKYIEYAESKQISIKKGARKGEIIHGIQYLASFSQKFRKSPDTWYCLKPKLTENMDFQKETNKDLPIIYIQKIFNEIFRVILASPLIIANNTFYKLTPLSISKDDYILLSALLQSSFVPFSLELHGRTNFGGGALDTATFDIAKIYVLNIENLTNKQKSELKKMAENLFKCNFSPINQNIFQEEKIKLDRKILSILDCQISLSDFYKDLLHLQNLRIKKAKYS